MTMSRLSACTALTIALGAAGAAAQECTDPTWSRVRAPPRPPPAPPRAAPLSPRATGPPLKREELKEGALAHGD